ncbi:hypothetical protein RS130_16690 [Paraglaciecola aquimarina]|uniref:NADPH--hemoprotein reductase n=1 Tax=Paraglaciecola aquimarina TaxID=1235557 RepID=A0ABU3SZ87_9ALTE|nr:hypothetical protein [Paraglaciecola aquimarina]MDU0355324.1 hypothetical protein [Paraglaciecola aquimarina]
MLPSTQYWRLSERQVLNPNCDDEALLLLTLHSIGPRPIWRAGDVIEIQPHHPENVIDNWLDENELNGETLLTYQGHQQSLKAWLADRELSKINVGTKLSVVSPEDLLDKLPYLHKRSYSVASVSENGQLQLVVRLFKKDDQSLGLASGFLGQYCKIGQLVQGQIKSINHHHHIQQTQPIILIGAGSGLAGLKAQIAARNWAKQHGQQNIGDTWLIFGERHSAAELPINRLLQDLKEQGITKLSHAFSRDEQYPKYVQHILISEQATLQQWLENGAAIYVCGCLSGMGQSVHQTLIDMLGEATVESLQQQQRYIRDVY